MIQDPCLRENCFTNKVTTEMLKAFLEKYSKSFNYLLNEIKLFQVSSKVKKKQKKPGNTYLKSVILTCIE